MENSLKKWVKEPFEYVVYDNCPDDAIKDECERLGITCKPIKIFSEDASWCVGLSLDNMWEELQHTTGKLWYIDSDMFLVNELPEIESDMAFVPQRREQYFYPWTGLMYFNMDTLPYPHEMEWRVDYNLQDTDVGGRNSYYLEDNYIQWHTFTMWTLTPDGYSLDGVDSDKYKLHYWMELLPFARPFDILTYDEIPFILHYKSASNHSQLYTPTYNRLKTEQLKKLLCQ